MKAVASDFSRTSPEREHFEETRRAFDGVAATYDRSNTDNALLSGMRERVRRTIERHVPAGARMLDLGCGPGSDAVHFAARGCRVTAIDWSPAMVREARRLAEASALADRVDVRHLGIQELETLAPAVFDAAYSNFGPLNCVPDLAAAARATADRLRPGGVLVASVIGRVCPWELALFAARGDWTRATVRFRRGAVPVPLEDGTIWTRYVAASGFARAFGAAGFHRVSLAALGLFAPPPYLDAFAARHPALTSCLRSADDVAGRWPLLRGWGDHFLIVMRKR